MKKDFDAVAFQRKTREKLSKYYIQNRKAFIRQLKESLSKRKKKAA